MKYKLELEITPEEHMEFMRGSMQWPAFTTQQVSDSPWAIDWAGNWDQWPFWAKPKDEK